MQASKALQDGEWEKCRDLIQNIKIWSLMPEEKTVKEMLARCVQKNVSSQQNWLTLRHSSRIQEEGLRTYLFTYSPYYTTLSLEMLARTFSLPLRTVTSIVSKMIWNEELAASLDQATGVVAFHRVELTRAQQLAQSLADKVGSMVEQSEKALDSKVGGASGTWGDRADKDQRGDQTQERNRRGAGTARGEHSYAVQVLQRLNLSQQALLGVAAVVVRGSCRVRYARPRSARELGLELPSAVLCM
jgi:translation initiation factor 3 subunit C